MRNQLPGEDETQQGCREDGELLGQGRLRFLHSSVQVILKENQKPLGTVKVFYTSINSSYKHLISGKCWELLS